MKRNGFSLLEAAIVLIIIGLLIAGISKASDLIKASELQGIIVQANKMIIDYNAFETVYKSVPGDFSSASAFFPNCAQTPTNCNGNGNGNIEWFSNVNDEVYKAMVHMNRAGLIDNTIPDMPDTHVGVILDQVVKTKRNAGIFYGGFGSSAYLADGQAPLFGLESAVYIGTFDLAFGYTYSAVNAPEAYNIDKKIDDGFYDGTNYKGYRSGKFRAGHDSSGTISCLTGIVGPSYNVIDEDSRCLIGFAVN